VQAAATAGPDANQELAKVPLYESVYIARPDISATQVEGLTETFTKVIEDNGGKVTKNEYWGLKSLAYRVKKNRKAHYSLMNIDAPAPALSEMERQMRLHEDVLRYMSIRVEEHEEGPSAMLQSKGREGRDRDRDRGDRGRGDRDRDRGDRGDRDRGDRGDRGDRDRGDRGRDESPRRAAADDDNATEVKESKE